VGVRSVGDLIHSGQRPVGCLLLALAASGCGGASTSAPPATVQRDVAQRFAVAVFRGDAVRARGMLVAPEEAALVFLVRRAAAPWRLQHASVRLPARRSGGHWTLRYAGRRTKPDGSFVTERGELVVDIAPSAAGAGVRYFGFRNVRIRFSTHHDALLLPSNR
jgi:hypothetical protein